MAATNASSGSTPASSAVPGGTLSGLALAGTTAPPSNDHSCARLYWPLVKSPPLLRDHRIVAVYVLIRTHPSSRPRAGIRLFFAAVEGRQTPDQVRGDE